MQKECFKKSGEITHDNGKESKHKTEDAFMRSKKCKKEKCHFEAIQEDSQEEVSFGFEE